MRVCSSYQRALLVSEQRGDAQHPSARTHFGEERERGSETEKNRERERETETETEMERERERGPGEESLERERERERERNRERIRRGGPGKSGGVLFSARDGQAARAGASEGVRRRPGAVL